jgi:tetratricopeptide (TPR) repeat protein
VITRLADLDVAIGVASEGAPRSRAPGAPRDARVLASEKDRDVLRSFARRIDPADPGAHNNLGVLYYNKGLYEEAVAAFMRALELDPRMQVAQRNLEIAYASSGYSDQRIAELRDRLRGNPSDRDTRWELGRTHALLGQHAEAIAEFTELLKYHPGDVAALIQAAMSQKVVGDLDVAQQWLEQALAADPESSLVHFYLGEIAYNRGLNDHALSLLQRAIALSPQNHDAWYLLAFVLGDAGRHEEAREASKRAAKLNPTLTRAQANLALTESKARYVDQAERGADAAPAVAGESALTHYNLGFAFRKRGYFAEAIGEYRIALERGEDPDLVEQALAEVHLLNRDPAAALQLFQALLERSPDSPKLWNEHGVALHQTGEYLAAEESYRRAIGSDGRYALAYNNLGVALYHAGNPDGALEAFGQALDISDAFVKARLNKALAHYKAKRLQPSLDAYRQVLSIEAEQPVAWNGIGLVLAELRKFEEARNAFARAIQARPKYAEAHYNLSFTLTNLGDFEGALRETKLALQLEPYYVAQKFELAIDVEYEDPDLAIKPDLGQERRTDAPVEHFDFDPRVLDQLFTEITPTPPAVPVPPADADHYAHATDLLTKGFFDRARAEAIRAMSRGGNAVQGDTLLGDIFARQGLWGEALERYRNARGVSPDFAPAMTGEATALLRLGRAIEARLVAESLLQRRPTDVETLMLAASARGDAEDPSAALAALENARRLAPMRADVHKHIGDIAQRLNDADGAIAAYRQALAIDARYAVVRYQLARLLIERKQLLDAERELLSALDAVPTYADATLLLVTLLRNQGRPDDALTLLIELLQRDPYHFDALIALGESLLDLGQRQDAEVAFARVLRFDPKHVGALYHEGAMLADQHRFREAIERWKEVIALAPTGEYARRARRQIKSAADLQRIFGAKAAG